MDVNPGQSGSPVWVQDAQGNYDIVGIVDFQTSSANGFVRITDRPAREHGQWRWTIPVSPPSASRAVTAAFPSPDPGLLRSGRPASDGSA
jgi:hypothetical protein